MQLSVRSRPARAGAGCLAVAVLACLGLAPAARAKTIHACVKPKSGATRIVAAKAKCHHGEQKLSWNTSGPAGARGPAGVPGASGAAGSEGKAGASGQGPVYSAAGSTSPQEIETETIVLSKVLPPGSYDMRAALDIGSEEPNPATLAAICAVIDSPGTTASTKGTTVDGSFEELPLGLIETTTYVALATMSLQGTFSSSATTTLSLACSNLDKATGPGVVVLDSQLQATAVSSIL